MSEMHIEKDDIWQELEKVFLETFGHPINITPEMSAKDVDEWDSLNHIRLMLSVERKFSIKFKNSDIAKFKDIGDLYNAIKSQLS